MSTYFAVAASTERSFAFIRKQVRLALIAAALVMGSAAIPGLVREALADARIATVDVGRLMNSTAEAKKYKTELDKKLTDLKKDLQKRRDTLQAIEKNLKAKGDSARPEEIEKFQTQARDFGRYVKDSEDDLQRQFRKSNDQLTKKTLDAVKRYAENNNIDLVLEKGQDARGAVLFRTEGADITDEIMKLLQD